MAEPAGETTHTALGESIKAFGAQVEKVRRDVAALELPDSAGDAEGLAESARLLEQATERLEEAHTELEAEMQVLEDLIDQERLRYRDLFEWAPDAYLVTGRDGTILETNSAAQDLFRYRRELMANGSIERLLSDSESSAFRLMLERMPMRDVVSDWELELKRGDGTTFPAAVTVAWLADRSGRGGSLRWLIRDISERRAVEEQMVSANLELERRVTGRTTELEALGREKDDAFARLEAVLDQIPAAIVIADAASGKVVASNEHAARLVAEVVGHGDALDYWLSIGFHGDGRPYQAEERPIMRALASGEIIKGGEIEFQRLDGTRALYETSAAPIRNADGQVVAAVAAYWDLTERVRLARAEREFVTNAAHELRTPLAALASAIEVLQGGAKENPRDRDRFLAHIEQQSNRLQRLVRSLLMLARLQTHQEKAEREPVSVQALLESVAALGPRDRVRVELRCPVETCVLANRELAEQALLNLVANATKYAPQGEVVLSGQTDNGFVSLKVADSGPGMTSEQRERGAQRFYRGRDDAGGFGLGLSIASQAAEALEGRLELVSDGKTGTQARLLLPLAGDDG
jgi:PAS domain S-box-containing protein